MRYFLVQFSKQPSGKFDEQATLAPKLKKNDIVKHAVVLDLELRRVEKCVIDGTVIDDFDKIINYYHTIYPDIFADYISNPADNLYLVSKYTQEGENWNEDIGYIYKVTDDFKDHNIILDIKNKEVIRCNIVTNDAGVPCVDLGDKYETKHDWNHVYGHYQGFYPDLCLYAENHLKYGRPCP